MKQSEDLFYKFIAISIGFHLVIFFALTVKILFFPSETPISQRSVRVDVVALPEKMVEPDPAPKAKPQVVKKTPQEPTPPKEVAKPKPKPKLKEKKVFNEKKNAPEKKEDVKEEQDSAMARLKAMQKLKAKQEDAKKAIEFKGNALSKGNSLTGLEQLHHESYLDELDGHIRNFWNLPEWLANGNFKASIILRIDKQGGIIDKKFISKSGNELFDQQVMGTIEKANPLPAPPSHLVQFYSNRGVEIRFPE